MSRDMVKIVSLFCLLLFIGTNSNAQQAQLLLPYGHTNPVAHCGYSKDNKLMLTRASDSTAGLWHVASGKLMWFGKGIIDAQFMESEQSILIHEKNKGLSILSMEDLHATLLVENKDNDLASFRYSAEKKTLTLQRTDHSSAFLTRDPINEKTEMNSSPYLMVQEEYIGDDGSLLCITPEGFLVQLGPDGKIDYLFQSLGFPFVVFKIFGDHILALDQGENVMLIGQKAPFENVVLSGKFTREMFLNTKLIQERTWVFSNSGREVSLFSNKTGQKINSFSTMKWLKDFVPISDTTIFAIDQDSLYLISDKGSVMAAYSFTAKNTVLAANSDLSQLAVGHVDGGVSLFDTKYRTVFHSIRKRTSDIDFIGKTTTPGQFILKVSKEKSLTWNTDGIRPVSESETAAVLKASEDICEKYRIDLSDICNDTLFIRDIITGQLLHFELKSRIMEPVTITSSCDKAFFVMGDHSIKMVNLLDSTETFLQGHSATVKHVEIFPDQSRIVSVSDDQTFRIWDLNSGENLVTGLIIDQENWILYTPDFYYAGAKSAVGALGWKKGAQVFSFDQFDLQKNRPDLLLGKLQNPNNELIEAYYNAHLKRLKRLNIKDKSISSDIKLPEIRITNKDQIPFTSEARQIMLSISAFDKQEKISSIHIFVNEVPIFGEKGINLNSENSLSVSQKIPVTLSKGKNKIEVMCINASGASSLKDQLWIEGMFSNEKHETYFVAFSVDNFKESGHDLTYAVKDGQDMARAMKTIKNAVIDTFFNAKATRDNFLALKKKLQMTNVDDEVVVFFSGHGLLDPNYDFFFASYDTEFKDPGGKGIALEDINYLLDGIPARKKLILLDACHSGEIDKSEVSTAVPKNATKEKPKGVKGAETEGGNEMKLTDSFILMQENFIELNKTSGSTFISASAGTGYAYESNEWDNGVFSYCILSGLQNLKADQNGDGLISTHELKRFVVREVSYLTNGLQVPTCREELNDFDWIIR